MVADTQYLMHTYNLEPVSFTRGEGAWLWDTSGRRYLDLTAGIAVVNLGHSHPEILKTLQDQAQAVMHLSNSCVIPQQAELARKLCQATGMTNAFFSNSGGEAVETALKLARLFGHRRGYTDPKIIALEKSFHGRTFATISASANALNSTLYAPLMPGFRKCSFNDAEALAGMLEQENEVTAVIVEPVQGEGGVNPLDHDYLCALRQLCDQHDCLMMMDEVQSGMGRTGALYAFMHSGVTPDVLASAKGLGNGFPIGATLARGEAATLFTPGSHGSTFGGNPLASAVAGKALDLIQSPGFMKQVTETGHYLRDGLRRALQQYASVREVRGKGMMIGIEMNRECPALRGEALKHGLIINITQKHIIRLTPPLVLSQQQCDQAIETIASLIDTFERHQ